jgi:amidohydrolase
MLDHLKTLRHALHRHPELSGHEHQTAARMAAWFRDCGAQVVTGLGGTGVAGVFDTGLPGPSVLFRAELDALPIAETSGAPWASQVPGRGHLCGHDGHLSILAGLARALASRPVARGRIVVLAQPAEETGAGARAVLADPAFAPLACDWAFAIHNMPGVALGAAWLAAGPVNCASCGLEITLTGKTAHASEPQAGLSPAGAVARLMPMLGALGPGGTIGPDYRLSTLTHVRLGEPTFGVAPGEAVLRVTLRALADAGLDELITRAQDLARAEAAQAGLGLSFRLDESFAACVNDPQATAHLQRAAAAAGIATHPGDLPMRGSEDFGLFGQSARAAMLFLGAGTDHPRLHHPDYDFPDELIASGLSVFETLARDLCG